jgi:hypothetical protein
MKRLFAVILLVIAAPAGAAWFDHLAVYGVGARSTPNKHGQVTFESLNLEATRSLKHGIDLGVVFAPTLMSQPNAFFETDSTGHETVHAASLSLLARHAFKARGSVQPYIELSSGPIYANKRVPESTSHYNFISQGGVGVTMTHGSTPLMLGIRFFHISNAGYADSNPGINFVGVLFGLRLR